MYFSSWISLEYYNSTCSLGTIDTAQVTPSYWIESCYRICDRYFPVATGLSHRRFAEFIHPPLRGALANDCRTTTDQNATNKPRKIALSKPQY